MQKLECEFKFAKLDIFLKIKPYSYLCHSYEIYLTVHDGNDEIDFCDRVPNEKNYG